MHAHHVPPWAVVLAIVIGVLVVAQSRVNGELAQVVDDGLFAAVISFGFGLLLLAVIVLVRPRTRRALVSGLPAELRAGRLKWWHLLGGLCGSTLVAGQGLTVPLLGVALFTVITVAGTTGTSLLVDRAGIGPGAARPVTLRRVVAAVGTTLAVALAVSGRFSAGDLAVWAVVLVFVAGAAVAVQPALNGQIAARTGDPLVATAVNFVVGLTALTTAFLVEHLVLSHAWAFPPPPWEQPLLWLGGPIGVIFVVSASIVVKPLGVLLFSLLNIGGQLAGSLIVDLVLPTPGTVVGWQLVSGVVLTGAAVTFAALRR